MTGETGEELEYLIDRFKAAPESRLFAPLADAYRKSGDISKAVEICEEGLKRFPDYASAHVILGKCFYDKGATERAKSEFMRVTEIDSENMVALKFIGDILLAEGKTDDAAEYYRKVIAIDPTNEEVGKALDEIEDEFQVKEIDLGDKRTVKQARKGGELATLTLASIYAAQGYYDKALKIYQNLLEKEPGNREVEEMIEKLEASKGSAGERREKDDSEDVLTISLEDVYSGGQHEASEQGIESESTPHPDRAVDTTEPGAEGEEDGGMELPGEEGEREEDEVGQAVEEMERMDRERAEDVEETGEDEEGGRKSTFGDIDNFQEWLRKMKGKKR